MKKRISWSKIDLKKIEQHCKETFRRYSEYPSIRDIYYAFVGVLFPNIKSAYSGLDKLLVLKRWSGEIDWRIIRDGSGREIHKGDIIYESPEDYFNAWLRTFKKCGENYELPKWTDQEKKIVVLCEKEADYPIVKSILSDLNVDVGYMRGYSGKRIMFEMVGNFKRSGRKPIVFVLGDFDPSGDDIKKNVRRDLLKLDLDIEPIDLSVTMEQIKKFKLPHKPEDSAEIEKLKRDPRYKSWKHGLFRVETASLRVREPDYFDNMLREAVKKHFDDETYEKILEEQKDKGKIVSKMVEGVIK